MPGGKAPAELLAFANPQGFVDDDNGGAVWNKGGGTVGATVPLLVTPVEAVRWLLVVAFPDPTVGV